MDSLVNYSDRREVELLRSTLEDYGSVLVALSGGIDSSFLLKASLDFLGPEKVLAVTSTGPIYPAYEIEEARAIAEELEAPWKLIDRDPMENADFKSNREDRCYHCKRDLFEELLALARQEGLNEVCDGTNRDDLSDHRPGRTAGKELDVKSPLERAELGKSDIRELSRKIGLPGWNKPSNSCLATRIPYGTEVTKERLVTVGKAETELMDLGFRGFRVRHHGDTARIELKPEELREAIEARTEIIGRLKSLGFTYVTLDLEGYRTGSLNEVDEG